MTAIKLIIVARSVAPNKYIQDIEVFGVRIRTTSTIVKQDVESGRDGKCVVEFSCFKSPDWDAQLSALVPGIDGVHYIGQSVDSWDITCDAIIAKPYDADTP